MDDDWGGPAYDANGNQLSSTGLSQVLWNANAQPTSVTSRYGGGAITGTYDALGRLVENGSGGKYTQIVFSPSGQKIASVQAGTLVKGTVPLPGGATAIYSGTSGMPYIRHLDWLGSSRLSTTWAHTVQSKVAYAPFGETYNEAGASSNDRSFTGQEQDTVQGNAATGIYDFLFRKYDPAAGRWLSPDPGGWNAASQNDPQSLDRYTYVTNRPTSLNDPLGLDCAYLNNSGVSIDSLDQQSNAGECASNGGYWANGAITNFSVLDNGVYQFTSLDASLNTLNTYYWGSANSNPTVDIDFTSYYYSMFVAQQQQQSQTMGSMSPDQRIQQIAAGVKRSTDCATNSLLKGSGTMALDAAGMVPFGGDAEMAAPVAIGALSSVNSAAQGDAAGSGLSTVEMLQRATITAVTSKTMGMNAPKGIPLLGQAYSAGLVGRDIWNSSGEYANCF